MCWLLCLAYAAFFRLARETTAPNRRPGGPRAEHPKGGKHMDLIRTKTFWTGMAGLLTALGAYLSGEANLWQAAQMGLTGLMAIFLRHGMARSGRG